MDFHQRHISLVCYGKVHPAPWSSSTGDLRELYEWLGERCGYAPQIWLSRSSSWITRFRQERRRMRSRWASPEEDRPRTRGKKGTILFGFDYIKGFPVSHLAWCIFIEALGKYRMMQDMYEENDVLECTEEALARGLDEQIGSDPEECFFWADTEGYGMPLYRDWVAHHDLERLLRDHLFIETDQVVVPSLNLKSAKLIICGNEKEKKHLRRLGFIEDRIEIRNVH